MSQVPAALAETPLAEEARALAPRDGRAARQGVAQAGPGFSVVGSRLDQDEILRTIQIELGQIFDTSHFYIGFQEGEEIRFELEVRGRDSGGAFSHNFPP